VTDPATPDVVVIGEALIDIVESASGSTEHVGGSPANVALGLGRLGVAVALLTQLGDDDRGRGIVTHLEASGVAVARESFALERTSTALARVAADGQASYVFDVAWNRFSVPVHLLPRVVHTGSVAAFVQPGADSVREALRSSTAAEVTFDPNIRPALLGSRGEALRAFEETAGLATVVKLSDEDAAWLYPGVAPARVVDTIHALGPRLVAVTLGADGAIVSGTAGRLTIPAERVDIIDTIGAGDTFMASLIASVRQAGSADLDRASLEQFGRRAVAAAAITVSRAGADLPWAHEL
jgi:fructokinase